MAERLTPLSERIGKVNGTRERRLYPYDRWTKRDGVLVPVEDRIDLDYDDKTGRFTVAAFGEWVSVEPANHAKIAARTREVRMEAHRFGPLLDKDASLDGDEDFVVKYSSGVTRTGAGDYALAEYPGVKLGVFLRDWQRNLGKGNVVHDFARSKDGEDVFVLRLGNVRKQIIDLDPELLYLDSVMTYVAIEEGGNLSSQAGWDTARGIQNAHGWDPGVLRLLQCESCSDVEWYRAAVRFDTSAVPAVTEWRLYFRTGVFSTFTAANGSVSALKVNLAADLTDYGNFGRCLSGSTYTIGTVGPCSAAGTYRSITGLDPTKWEATSTFDVAFLTDVDHADNFTKFENDYGYYVDGGLYAYYPGPYLQYFPVPDAAYPILRSSRSRARSELGGRWGRR